MSDDLKKMLIELVARKLLVGVGVWLATVGWIGTGDEASFAQIGAGIIVGAAGFAWSWWREVGAARVRAELAKVKGGGK